MRRLELLLAAGLLLLGACSDDAPVEPITDQESAIDVLTAQVGYATAAPDPFPAELRLTDAQKAQIAALTQQFRTETAADRSALETIMRQAAEARRAGKSAQEVRAIVETGLPMRQRVEAAHRQLMLDVRAVYTPAQLAWLEEQRNRCTATPLPPLTEAQRAQIAALVRSFEEANRADLQLLRQLQADARTARQAGASEAEIRAILERGREAHARLAAGQRVLQAAIEAILPPRPTTPPCGLRLPTPG